MPTVPRDQSNSWFYNGISYLVVELDWISKPQVILCSFTAPVPGFVLTHVVFLFWAVSSSGRVITPWRSLPRNGRDSLYSTVIPSLPFLSKLPDRKGLWKIRTPPSLSHITEKLPFVLWHLPTMELSALGAALAYKGKSSLWWGCAVDFSLHLERNCQTVEGQSQSVLLWVTVLSFLCWILFSSLCHTLFMCFVTEDASQYTPSVVCSFLCLRKLPQKLLVVVVSLSAVGYVCVRLLFFHNKSFNNFFITGTTHIYRPKLWFQSLDEICRFSSILR